jgi:competence protein ComEA
MKKAGEIVKYRELNGNFKSIDELVNVKGIGVKMVAKIIDLVKV